MRPLLYRTDTLTYHVTTRSNNREFFYISHEESWEIFTFFLSKAAEKYGANIHTFVLMSNHFHLLITTPQGNLDDVMRYFLSESTREIQRQTSRINHILGARYKWSILKNSNSIAYAYKYILRNPVVAELCEKVEDYKYSTLNNLKTPLCISEGINGYWSQIPRNNKDRIDWLNIPTRKECEMLIKNALRRYSFSFSTNSNTQKLLRELKSTYGVESS
jgi:REP element-mobilizing transposase RayT